MNNQKTRALNAIKLALEHTRETGKKLPFSTQYWLKFRNVGPKTRKTLGEMGLVSDIEPAKRPPHIEEKLAQLEGAIAANEAIICAAKSAIQRDLLILQDLRHERCMKLIRSALSEADLRLAHEEPAPVENDGDHPDPNFEAK